LRISDPSAEKWGIQVSECGTGCAIQAHTIKDLLRLSGCEKVDILKLDIEGAEEQLFGKGETDWIDLVNSIVIEFHDMKDRHCAETFYKAICGRRFLQHHRGENIFIRFV
jgi:hypothetical protein